jgi:hypothetical protein
MNRRQYLMATGTVFSTGFAGCLGGNEDTGPTEPYIESINVQTTPQIRVSPQVRNPTDNQVERRVWVRVVSKDGETLATDSKSTPIPPNESAPIPFIYDNVSWSGTEVDTDKTEAALTAPDVTSPPF